MVGIYKITNNINGKVYIGKSVDIKERWRQERYKQPNKYFANAVKKYGLENFSFEVLEECSKEELDEKEKKYIEKYNSTDINIGYNITSGGTGGAMPSEVIQKSLETKEKNGTFTRYWKGKQIPQEERKRISENLKKEKNPNYNKSSNHREIICLEDKRIFDSVKSAANYLNVNTSKLRYAILNRKSINNLHFQYLKKRPKIKNIDTGEIFLNAKEAAKKYGNENSSSIVYKACKGRRKKAFGFRWEYYYD